MPTPTTGRAFQHTATRRWLQPLLQAFAPMPSFNTQPPEGGCLATEWLKRREAVSTHSHPKVAAPPRHRPSLVNHVPTHSHPKVAANGHKKSCPPTAFQHTATRRWLLRRAYHGIRCAAVSTHSHPKVAAVQRLRGQLMALCFNTQPPEGGCHLPAVPPRFLLRFNTQPPEGGCACGTNKTGIATGFNTQPPEGGCAIGLCCPS